MTTHDDQQLLEVLNRALSPGPVAPPPERVGALRATVARQGAPPALPSRRHTPGIRWRRPVPLLAAGAILASAIPAAAFATGATLPRPLREMAHALHLPVDSPALADARAAAARLRDVLPCGDHTRVRQSAATLREKLAALDEPDRRPIGAEAARLLRLAEDTPGPQCDKPTGGGTADSQDSTPLPTVSPIGDDGHNHPTTPAPPTGDHQDPTLDGPGAGPGVPDAGGDHAVTGPTTTTTEPETTTTTEPETTTTTEPETTTTTEPETTTTTT